VVSVVRLGRRRGDGRPHRLNLALDSFEGIVANELGKLEPNVPYGYYSNQVLLPQRIPGRDVFNEFDNVLLLPWAAYSVEVMSYIDGYYDIQVNGKVRYRAGDGSFHLADGNTRELPHRFNPVNKGKLKTGVLNTTCRRVSSSLARYPVEFILVVPDGASLAVPSIPGTRVVNLRRLVANMLVDQRTWGSSGTQYAEADLQAVFAYLNALPPETLAGTICHEIRLNDEVFPTEAGCPVPFRAFDGEEVLEESPGNHRAIRRVQARFYRKWPWGKPVERHIRHVLRRLQALARVKAPGVLGVARYADEPDQLMVAYEYFDGRPLNAVVEAGGPLAPALARDLLRNLLRTVQALHDCHIIHLDIRPQHVLVTPNLTSHRGANHKLAGLTNPHVDEDNVTTAVYNNPFDCSFSGPELHQSGGPRSTPAPDIYSLGRLALYCLLGDAAYRERVVRRDFTPPAGDATLARAIQTANESYPAARFANCGEMLAALGDG
jgi:hypothetical protein